MELRSTLILLLTALCSCQPRLDGLYSICWDTPDREGCEYINLRKDGTFLYSDPYNVSGNIDTHGQWKANNDTLILNTNHQLYKLVYTKTTKEIEFRDSVKLIFTSLDPSGEKFNIGAFSEVNLGFKSETIAPDSTGNLIVNRNDLIAVRLRHVGIRQFWITDISRDREFDKLEIQYNTEFMYGEIFENEKWIIKSDSILIPTVDDSGKFLNYRILERNKTKPNTSHEK